MQAIAAQHIDDRIQNTLEGLHGALLSIVQTSIAAIRPFAVHLSNHFLDLDGFTLAIIELIDLIAQALVLARGADQRAPFLFGKRPRFTAKQITAAKSMDHFVACNANRTIWGRRRHPDHTVKEVPVQRLIAFAKVVGFFAEVKGYLATCRAADLGPDLTRDTVQIPLGLLCACERVALPVRALAHGRLDLHLGSVRQFNAHDFARKAFVAFSLEAGPQVFDVSGDDPLYLRLVIHNLCVLLAATLGHLAKLFGNNRVFSVLLAALCTDSDDIEAARVTGDTDNTIDASRSRVI